MYNRFVAFRYWLTVKLARFAIRLVHSPRTVDEYCAVHPRFAQVLPVLEKTLLDLFGPATINYHVTAWAWDDVNFVIEVQTDQPEAEEAFDEWLYDYWAKLNLPGLVPTVMVAPFGETEDDYDYPDEEGEGVFNDEQDFDDDV